MKLRVLLEDGSYYLKPVDANDSRDAKLGFYDVSAGAREVLSSTEPFDKFADHSTVQTYLQSACHDCVQK